MRGQKRTLIFQMTCQDDAGHGDEGFDVELMHNVVSNVLFRRRNKGFNNFEMLHKASRDLYEECK
jgi:hypothetical protein